MILYNQSDYNSVTCISIHGSTHPIIMPIITPTYMQLFVRTVTALHCTTHLHGRYIYPAGIFHLIVVIMFNSAFCVATAYIGYVCPDGWTGDDCMEDSQ